MRLSRVLAAFACLVTGTLLFSGCGSSGSSTGSTSSSAQSHPAPPKGDFPSAKGKTLGQVLESKGATSSELVVSPAAQVFNKGENRYPFGVFERDRTQVPDAEVALYFAKMPPVKGKGTAEQGAVRGGTLTPKEAEERALNQPAKGPFPASIESMQTKPAFRAQTTSSDPDAAAAVYSTQVDFPSEGE